MHLLFKNIPLKQVAKSFCILLIGSIFIFYTAANYFFYRYLISSAESEALDKLTAGNELVSVRIPINEITWIHEHEFIWNGEMYDVDKNRIENGFLICNAYHDKKEKEITENYISNYSDQKDNSSNSHQNHTIKHRIDFIPSNELHKNNFSFQFTYIQPLFYYENICITLFSPPPESIDTLRFS